MEAKISMVFYSDHVLFQLDLPFVPCAVPEVQQETEQQLPTGCFLMCADDDAAPRASYKGLAKKLKMTEQCFLVLGKTHGEAAGVV